MAKLGVAVLAAAIAFFGFQAFCRISLSSSAAEHCQLAVRDKLIGDRLTRQIEHVTAQSQESRLFGVQVKGAFRLKGEPGERGWTCVCSCTSLKMQPVVYFE